MNKKIPAIDLKKLTAFISPYADKFKKLLPAERPRYSLGLDIGTTSVKLVQLQKTGKEFKLVRYGIAPLGKDNKEGAVKKILADNSITAKNVNIAVSGQGVILRYVAMPKMPLDELKASVLFESDKYMPFPADEVVTDCYIIKELPQERKILVLVAAAKKDLIEQKISLLDKAGLTPEVITIDAVALANVFNVFCQSSLQPVSDQQGSTCQAVAVINIGGAFSSLNIIERGLPLFTRDIFIGGQDFTKRIMNHLGLDADAAEKLKTSPELDWQQIIDACETSMSNLVTEIRFSFDYFETGNNLPVSLLYITGGGANLKGIGNFLQQNLGIKVELWNPISGLQAGEEIAAASLKKNANELGVALGLALY